MQQVSALSGVLITYCVAEIGERKGMSLDIVYNICAEEGKAKDDDILCLLPGTPLMITQNISVSHGTSLFILS